MSNSLKTVVARGIAVLFVFVPTIYLLAHPVKYYLYLLQVLVGLIVYNIVNGSYLVEIRIRNRTKEIFSNIFYLLSMGSLIIYPLVIGEKLQIPLIIKIALVIILLTFIPGWSLLNLLMPRWSFISIKIVLSFTLGYFLTIMTTLIAWILLRIDKWYQVTLLMYSILVFFAFIKSLQRNNSISMDNNFVLKFNLYDILTLSAIMVFFAIAVYLVFPDYFYVIDTDMSRHYMESIILSRSPDLYNAYAYFGFHLFTSTYSGLINDLEPISFIGISCLNLMQNLAFFAMSTIFFAKSDSRLPSLSTIVWSLFSSFAWLYVFALKITNGETLSQEQILWMSIDPTYRSVLHPQGLWFVEFLPFGLSFALMFTFIGLFKIGEYEKDKWTVFSVPVMVSLLLTHVLTAIVTLLVLFFHVIVTNGKNYERLLLSAVSSIIILILIYWVSVSHTNFNVNFFLHLVLISLESILILGKFILPKIHNIHIKVYVDSKGNYLLHAVILMLYFTSFLFWSISLGKFHVADVFDIGYVPWYYYPFLLGLTGLLASACIVKFFLFKATEMSFFVSSSFVILITGKLISFVNTYLFYTYVWEHRVFYFLPAFLSTLAALYILDINTFLLRKCPIELVRCIIMSLIVLLGTSSLMLPIEFQNYIVRVDDIKLSPAEMEAMNYLKDYFQIHPYTAIISLTTRSYHALAFAGPPYRFLLLGDSGQVYACYNVLRTAMLPREFKFERILVYIYNTEKNEVKYLHLTSYVADKGIFIFNNKEVSIYELPLGMLQLSC
jgi:hypothetical protein